MKRKLSSLFLGVSLVLSSVCFCSDANAQPRSNRQEPVQIEQQAASQDSKGSNSEQDNSQQKVYVCYGKRAYAYHNNRQCHGLNRCKGCIKSVTIGQAKKEDRKPCGYCYGNR